MINTLKPQPRLGDKPFTVVSLPTPKPSHCNDVDPLAPARGILNASIIWLVMWVVAYVVWRIC